MADAPGGEIPDLGPVVTPVRVTFALSNLKLKRTIRFDQLVIMPEGVKGVRVDEEPGHHWEITDQGVYVWRDPQPQHERDLYVRQHDIMDRLQLLLSFARGGYVPVLNTAIHSRNGDLPRLQRGMIIRWEVARGYSTIYSTDDQLETFMRQAFPRFKPHDGPWLDPLRGPIFELIQACDEDHVEAQLLLAWIALESAVASSVPDAYLISRSKFEKHVRLRIKDAIAAAAVSDPVIAQASESMIAKIPELNRPPVTDAILGFFQERGVPTDRQEIEGLKKKRDTITHTGVAEDPPEVFTEEWFDGYRDRLHEASWRLINLTRAAFLYHLIDEPLRSELRQDFLPDRYPNVI